ncbi:TPA: oligosaccharide flippase family protein [Vibrio parahaemolyticus]|nr:oligosaccharide flippase family protein [Vibrio parahaemolyticus]HCG7214108.1 oligosaccharide flippase family protein [Vibrio parahaemolyticus]
MKKLKENSLVKLLMSTFLAKVCISFGGILLSVVISNFYGINTLGEFFIFQMTVITFSVVLSLGMSETLVLFTSRYNSNINVSQYFIYSAFVSISLLLILSILFIYLDFSWFSINYSVIFDNKIYYIFSSLSCLINILLSGFMKGIKKPAYAVLLENGAVSISCVIIILLSRFLYVDSQLNIAIIYCYSTWLVTIVGFWNFRESKNLELRKPNDKEVRLFFNKNWSFYSMVLCGLVSTSIISLYIGYVLTPEDVAIFRIMQQICVLISFSLIILNAVMPAYISGLFKEKSMISIEKYSVETSKYATIISLPIYFICILYPREIISLFGSDVNFNYYFFIMLATAQLFNVSTGSVASVLKMCGYEKELNNIVIFTSVISIIILFIITPDYGLLGAIIASSSVLILQNSASLYMAKAKLGISTAFYIRKNISYET